MLAGNLLRGIALDALGAFVPREDLTLRVQVEDRVVADTGDQEVEEVVSLRLGSRPICIVAHGMLSRLLPPATHCDASRSTTARWPGKAHVDRVAQWRQKAAGAARGCRAHCVHFPHRILYKPNSSQARAGNIIQPIRRQPTPERGTPSNPGG